jgi:hypothetical protein
VTNIKKLPIKGITAEEVLALWQEGRLYLQEDRTPETANIEEEVRAYVSAIHSYVAPEWQPCMADLWQAIIADRLFAPMLVMRKGRMQGHLNRYIVTNIVFHLKALDIYQCDSLLELHKRLERVDKKNSVYKSAGMYCLNRAQRQRIREIANSPHGLKKRF